MNIVESIANYFSRKENGENLTHPDGVCPNCWGKQEWDGKYLKGIEDQQIDVNNKVAKYAFIQDFVIKHIDGIKLKEHHSDECALCSRKMDK